MSEKDFLAYKLDLESRLVFAYSAYYNNLAPNEQKALEQAQKTGLLAIMLTRKL